MSNPPPSNSSSEVDDRSNLRSSSTAPLDPTPSHMSRSLTAPPIPPHGYRHPPHPHPPTTHPHQQMIFMPLPHHPGARRDPLGPPGMPRSQQHLTSRPPHAASAAASHPSAHHAPPHQPHLYYNHRAAPAPPPHHPFMMSLQLQQRFVGSI